MASGGNGRRAAPRRSRGIGFLAGLALATATMVACLGAPAASAQPLFTGITDPLTTYDAPFLAYQRMRAAGAKYVRLTIGWREVAPREEPDDWDPTDPLDPHYWWPNADRQVASAAAAGLTPLVALTGAPSWGQRCERDAYSGAVCNLDAAAFASFAAAIARRYNGSFPGLPWVRYWQPQNEPNSPLFFFPQFGPDGQPVAADLYREILSAFSPAVKAAHPANLVITAGLAPLGRPGSVAPLAFARRLLCMTGRRRPRPAPSGCEGGLPFDIFAINPYTTGGPTHSAFGRDDVSLGDLGELQTLLRAADRANRIRGAFKRTPLWITEFSWDSSPPDPGGLPSRLHARWVSEAVYRAWAAGVDVFFWYGLRDEAPGGKPPNQTVDSGLYLRGTTFEEDRPKQALEAFRFPFVALDRRRGFFVWGKTPRGTKGKIEVQLWRRGRWRTAGALRAGGSGVFEGRIRSRFGSGSVRAVFRKQPSLPFSLHYVEDFYQPPFG